MLLLNKELPPTPSFIVHDKNTCPDDPKLYFSPEECMWIRQWAEKRTPQFASVGVGEQSEVRRSTRDVYLYGMPRDEITDGVFRKILYQVDYANKNAFDFELTGILHDLQVLKYDSKTEQHYDWHIDISGGNSYGRKISYSLQLSDPSEYEGGTLEIYDGNNHIVPQAQGTAVMFPSYMCHRVAPVTAGTRWSLVIWIQGSSHFR